MKLMDMQKEIEITLAWELLHANAQFVSRRPAHQLLNRASLSRRASRGRLSADGRQVGQGDVDI